MNMFRPTSILLLIVLTGCSASGNAAPTPSAGAVPTAQVVLQATPAALSSLGPLETVGGLQQRLGVAALLGHAAADNAFASLKSAFAANTHRAIRLAIYNFNSIPDLSAVAKAKANALGMDMATSTFRTSATGDILLSNGRWDLTVDSKTGGEFYVDPSRHHRGMETQSLLGDDVYAQKAAAYIATQFTPLSSAQSAFPAQIHHYHNASVGYGVGGDPTTRGPVSDGVYEIAVVHNTAVDGLPVIGPGGRYKVWMSPTGEVVAHRSSVRTLGTRHAVLTGDQLVDPGLAQAKLEAKLVTRGVTPNSYTLTEAQFGYLQRDNGAVQSLLAPYFIFVYSPVRRDQKLVVEVVPAISDPVALADVLADEAAEEATHPAVPTNVRKR